MSALCLKPCRSFSFPANLEIGSSGVAAPRVPRALVWKERTAFPRQVRDYRCVTRDNRTYVIEPRDGRPLGRSTSGKGNAAHPGSLSPRHRWTGAGFHASGGSGTKENFQNGHFCPEQGIGQNIMLDGVLFGLSVPSMLSNAAARHSLTKKNLSQKSR
jgi:hypothetical protein